MEWNKWYNGIFRFGIVLYTYEVVSKTFNQLFRLSLMPE